MVKGSAVLLEGGVRGRVLVVRGEVGVVRDCVIADCETCRRVTNNLTHKIATAVGYVTWG